MQFLPPVQPYRGTRQIDAFGGGGFNAPRSRNGTSYGHRGLDFIATPGDSIVTPCRCLILRPGDTYGDGALETLHLQGVEDGNGFSFKLLYAKQLHSFLEGVIVPPGTPIALAQNVSDYHERKAADGRKMTNHVHFELRKDSVLVDPTSYFLGASV